MKKRAPKPFKNVRRVLTLWAAILVAGLVGAEAFTSGLAIHARHVRDKDYRTNLAAAAESMDSNDVAGALRQVEEALRKAPDASQPHVVAGDIHFRLKRWEQAIAAYERALAKGSRVVGTKLNTVWALIELKQYDRAVAFGEGSVAEGKDAAALSRYIAEAHLRAGRPVDAIPHLERALEGYPDDRYLLDHLERGYVRAGREEDAEKVRGRIAEVQASLNEL